MPKAGRGYITGHGAPRPPLSDEDIAGLTASDLEHRARLAAVWGVEDAEKIVASAAMGWARTRLRKPAKGGPRRKK